MIKEYIDKLINNIPLLKKKEREKINLILDGGLFNGSYLIGALYFLEEMEKRDLITIQKISACSIGSIAAVLFCINRMYIANEIYEMSILQFKKELNFKSFDSIFQKIENLFPENICELMNDRVFISYYDLKKRKKITKSKYKNRNDVIDTMKRSCFVPYLINGDITYKNKYIDGIYPYIFPNEQNIKNLYLDLLNYDKIFNAISIKNEKTNFHRILSGLLEMHLFFIKKKSTQMCSFIDTLSINYIVYHYFIKKIVENILFYIVYFFYLLQKYNKYIPSNIQEYLNNNIFIQIINSCSKEIVDILLKNFCL